LEVDLLALVNFSGQPPGVCPRSLGFGLTKGFDIEVTLSKVGGDFKVVGCEGESMAEEANGLFGDFVFGYAVVSGGSGGKEVEGGGEVLRVKVVARSVAEGFVIAVKYAWKVSGIFGFASLGGEVASDVVPGLGECGQFLSRGRTQREGQFFRKN
jgi:hypothetical protein